MITVFLALASGVWKWIKKYWKYLIPIVGGVIFIMERLLQNKPQQQPVAGGELVAHEAEEATENEAAAAKKAQADVAESIALGSINAAHTTAVADLAATEVAAAKSAENDPDKVNELLLDTGKEMRK